MSWQTMRKQAGVMLLAVLCLCAPLSARGAETADEDEDEENSNGGGSRVPNIYVDLRTTLSALPPGVISFGFRNFSSLTVSSRPTRGLTFDLPLTVDLTDYLSIYGGISASTSRTDVTPWRQMTLDTWSLGFQADVYQQNGGWFPTVTIQSTLTRSIPQSALASTSFTTIAEFGYAFDEDETRGALAGVQYTSVTIDSPLASFSPAVVGYVGGYYQWPSNWKLTGRIGIQSFNGARLLNFQPLQPFTQPVVRLDLDRMDDNDNRLFGLTAEVAWTPKPVFSLVIRTPLYAIKN